MSSSGNSSKRDIGWKYCYQNDGEKSLRCKFCHHQSNGGVTRLKQHLAQTHKGVAPCAKVRDDVKKEIKDALEKAKTYKLRSTQLLREIGEGLGSNTRQLGEYDIEDVGTHVSSSKQLKGTLDGIVTSELKQTTLNSAYKKELLVDVKRRIGHFFYSAALPFNVINDPYFKPMCDGIAEYGKGFKPPSMHELRTWILKAEVEDIHRTYDEHKQVRKQVGCTIMSDGWTDRKNRSLINFLINSPAGTFFLKSVDASASIKNGDLIFGYLNEVITEVGEENVIHIITDNALNCVKAGKKIMEVKKNVWWTPCAAHCIDLMLEDIAKIEVVSQTITHAKTVVKFFYGHGTLLYLIREYTKGKEIIRPAVTRFATAFLTLQSMYKVKREVQNLFSSEHWANSREAKTMQGKVVKRLVVNDPNFWRHMAFCIKSIVPLVSVLREVDSEERPAMGYIYELIQREKEMIKFNCGAVQKRYMPIWKKIDARWAPQLHHPLHAAGYYLNPQLHYGERFINSVEIRQGLYACMDKMMGPDDRLIVDIQLDSFNKGQGEFGTTVAKISRMLQSPASWWERFVTETLELMSFAIHVLSLTCSASGCERNWSTFELIHTKKRNKLEHKRLNALVYVKYNLKLRERSIKRRNKIDPIVVDEIDSDDEWITEKEDSVLPTITKLLEDDELFEGYPIVSVPPGLFDSLLDSDRRIEDNVVDVPPTVTKKRVGESSSGVKDKGKQPRICLVDEDVTFDDVDEHGGLGLRNFDSGNFPTIDSLDDDSNTDLDDEDNDYF